MKKLFYIARNNSVLKGLRKKNCVGENVVRILLLHLTSQSPERISSQKNFKSCVPSIVDYHNKFSIAKIRTRATWKSENLNYRKSLRHKYLHSKKHNFLFLKYSTLNKLHLLADMKNWSENLINKINTLIISIIDVRLCGTASVERVALQPLGAACMGASLLHLIFSASVWPECCPSQYPGVVKFCIIIG